MIRRTALAFAITFIAMTAAGNAMDTADLAGRAGFLIGAARYCGVSTLRASHLRRWIAANLVAAGGTRQVVYRFDDFIDAASSASGDGDFSVRCGAITDAFATIEHHLGHSRRASRAVEKKSGAPRLLRQVYRLVGAPSAAR